MFQTNGRTLEARYNVPRPRDWHVRLGLALGFPECCVSAFVDSIRAGIPAAAERGSYCLGRRTDVPQIVYDYGMEDDIQVGSPMTYVPCGACMGGEGWLPFGEYHPEEEAALAEGIA